MLPWFKDNLRATVPDVVLHELEKEEIKYKFEDLEDSRKEKLKVKDYDDIWEELKRSADEVDRAKRSFIEAFEQFDRRWMH